MMVNKFNKVTVILKMIVTLLAVAISACAPRGQTNIQGMITPLASTPIPAPTSGRPAYSPGELVDYIAQNGDTLPALAARFNTTIEQIMQANPIIPADATTMPVGLPMKIPIYYLPLWGTAYQSLPDQAFINGPAQIGFSTPAFVASTNGWLKDYRAYAGGKMRTGAEIVDFVAMNYSVSPRFLLAVLEYQSGALTQPEIPAKQYMLGMQQTFYDTPYLQLVVAANVFNNGYYGWRAGKLTEFELLDKTIVRPDPWQNAASVAIQHYFSILYSGNEYYVSIGPDGLARTYKTLFGDPWANPALNIPGSLHQPSLILPFPPEQVWTYTGGPHTGWGKGEPLSAVDFAPPAEHSGCVIPNAKNYAVAMADGLVVRSSVDGLALDLDGDGDERTGWVLFYLHLASDTRAPVGKQLHAGDLIGYPSCEGGETTGTHVHIARKYNGEWVLADGPLAFNMEGWVAHDGSKAYQGTFIRGAEIVKACDCSDSPSRIASGSR